MSRVVGGEREVSVNLFIVGIKVVTYAMFLCDRVNWTVVQCEKNRAKNRTLWHTKEERYSDRIYFGNRNRLTTNR